MQLLDVASVRTVFGELLRNAQALDTLLNATGILLTPEEAAALTQTLQAIQARIVEQSALLNELLVDQDVERRHGPRRQYADRRSS